MGNHFLKEGVAVMRTRRRKGQMARELVYFCIRCLALTLLWAVVLKTAAVIMDRTVDLSDVLVFAGAAFGGELLLLLCKRVFAKPNENQTDGSEM